MPVVHAHFPCSFGWPNLTERAAGVHLRATPFNVPEPIRRPGRFSMSPSRSSLPSRLIDALCRTISIQPCQTITLVPMGKPRAILPRGFVVDEILPTRGTLLRSSIHGFVECAIALQIHGVSVERRDDAFNHTVEFRTVKRSSIC